MFKQFKPTHKRKDGRDGRWQGVILIGESNNGSFVTLNHGNGLASTIHIDEFKAIYNKVWP